MSGFTANGETFHVGDQIMIDYNHSHDLYSNHHKWIRGVVQCVHQEKMCVHLDGNLEGAGCRNDMGHNAWSICEYDHYFVKLTRRKETMPLLTELRKQTSMGNQ